jgi:hypothetical protein
MAKVNIRAEALFRRDASTTALRPWLKEIKYLRALALKFINDQTLVSINYLI